MTRKLSLRARMSLALGAIAAAVMLLAVLANIALRELGGAIGTILVENYVSVIACEEMTDALERLDSAALFSVSGQDVIAGPMRDRSRAAFEAALSREKTNITLPGEGELTARVEREYAEYVATVDRLLGDPRTKTTERYFAELLPRFSSLKGDVHSILRMNQANMEAADRVARARARTTTGRNAGISIAIVLFVVSLAWWLPAALIKPLAPLREATIRVGEGNLDEHIPTPTASELVPLAEAFNAMLDRLRVYRQSSLGELLAAKDLARTTVACLDDPVMVIDREGSVLLTNPAFEAVFGTGEGTREELSARGVTLPDALVDAADRVLETGEPVRPQSFAQAMKQTSKGTDHYFLVRAAPLRNDEDQAVNAIVLAQDVTRFRTIDEAKSHIVATVSHEFKTPLTSLRMATHMLLEANNGPLTDNQRELVTTARDDAERLLRLVNEFLDLAKLEAEAGTLRRTKLDVHRLLVDAQAAHGRLADDKRIALALEEGSHVELLADAEKLSVVLANLLSNAIRHTPEGGRVTLGARADADKVTLTVRDTGEGIDQAALPRIFDRFERGEGGEQDGHRMGLGLAIAREIVQQHGGSIRVESRPGRGATFSVDLPRE